VTNNGPGTATGVISYLTFQGAFGAFNATVDTVNSNRTDLASVTRAPSTL
jgi:hypothetical protein